MTDIILFSINVFFAIIGAVIGLVLKATWERMSKIQDDSRRDDEKIEEKIERVSDRIEKVEDMRRDNDRELYGIAGKASEERAYMRGYQDGLKDKK